MSSEEIVINTPSSPSVRFKEDENKNKDESKDENKNEDKPTEVQRKASEKEDALKAEISTLKSTCNTLLNQNEDLQNILEDYKHTPEYQLGKSDQAFKDELDALEKVNQNTCCHVAEEIIDMKKRHSKEISYLQRQNMKLKSFLKHVPSRRQNILSLISSTLTTFKPKDGSDDSDGEFDSTAAIVREIDQELVNIEIHLRPLHERLKQLKLKMDGYFDQLTLYRGCFDWLSEVDEQFKPLESVEEINRKVIEEASDIRQSFEGLNFKEIVQLCFVDKDILGRYLAMLKTQVAVQKKANEGLAGELSGILVKLSTAASVSPSFEECSLHSYRPFDEIGVIKCQFGIKDKSSELTIESVAEASETHINIDSKYTQRKQSPSMSNLLNISNSEMSMLSASSSLGAESGDESSDGSCKKCKLKEKSDIGTQTDVQTKEDDDIMKKCVLLVEECKTKLQDESVRSAVAEKLLEKLKESYDEGTRRIEITLKDILKKQDTSVDELEDIKRICNNMTESIAKIPIERTAEGTVKKQTAAVNKSPSENVDDDT